MEDRIDDRDWSRARTDASDSSRGIGSMQSLRALPLPVRWTVVGATAGVLFGCVLGLVVGLVVHWQTAWFAVFELGVPASILGGLLGLACGAIAWTIQQAVRKGRHA